MNTTPPTTISRLTTEYLRGPDLGGGVGGMVYSIDHRQSQIGNPIYSHSNHRGVVIAPTDENGSLTWYAVYECHLGQSRNLVKYKFNGPRKGFMYLM